MKSLISIVVLVCTIRAAFGQVIDDPVRDFLTLPIEDRYGDSSVISRLDKVRIDLDLDGKAELLVGHHKMWLGDNEAVYFAIYRELPNGDYKRLTKPNEDIALTLRDGRPEYNFVGRVDELGEIGLLVCNPPQGDGELSTHRVESRVFVSIAGDVVHVRELPGLDLSKESDQAFYRKYFPLPGKQGGYQSESFKPDALKALGIELPDWTKPIQLEADTTSTNQSSPHASSTHIVERPAPKKIAENASAISAPSEEPTSSTPWGIFVVMIVAAIGLLWLLLKRRS
jgi:hypothetical protein